MKRKVLFFALAAVLAFAACGCGESAGGNGHERESAPVSDGAGGNTPSQDISTGTDQKENGSFWIETVNADTVKIYLKNPAVNTMRYIDDEDIANNITISFERGDEEISRCAVHAKGINGTFYRAEHAIFEDYSRTSFADDTVCWTLEYSGIADDFKSCDLVDIRYSDFVDHDNSYEIMRISGKSEIAALFDGAGTSVDSAQNAGAGTSAGGSEIADAQDPDDGSGGGETDSNAAPIDDFQYYQEDDGTVYLLHYDGSATDMVVPGRVDGKPTKIGMDCFRYAGLTSVVIPDGVVEIGDNAFALNENLTSVIIGNDVTGIGESVFYGCPNLTDVTFGDHITVIKTEAFRNCSKITELHLPDSLTEIGILAFCMCTGLRDVTIPDSVTSIGRDAFVWCEEIRITYKGTTYDYEHIQDFYNAVNGSSE